MTSSENKIIAEFVNSFPRQDIVNTLKSIDNKIGSLHTISSKDFLYFNKLLKQYYSYIKDISNTNNNISIFFNENLLQIKDDIKDRNNLQIQLLSETEDTINKIIQYLSSVFASFDLFIVPINNFKQNLITLKYVLANLKLHLNYIDIKNVPELQKSILAIENGIEKIHNQFENLASKTELVAAQITQLKNNSCISENLNNSVLKDELKKVLNSFKRISSNDYVPENAIQSLNTHTQKSFSYLGEVITNIQYHDIIRQKMEHIQTSQNLLINEISNIDPISANNDDQLQIIVKIPEITDIQVAQLLYTNKDYQTSIEKITNQLLEVGHEMKTMHNIYTSIHENLDKFENTFVANVLLTQNYFESYFENLLLNWTKTSAKVDSLNSDYFNLKNEFNTIFNSEKALRTEVRNFEKLINENGKMFGKDLLKRLANLFSDIQINSNSLKTHINNSTQNLFFLTTTISNFKPENKNHYINSSINELSEKSKEIRLKSKEYAEISDQISSEIAQSIKKIEYYTFFKSTVEEIVTMLGQINQVVNFDSLKNILGDNKEYLNKIKDLYTMKSERDVHSQLTNAGKNIDEIANEKDSSNYNIDDDDIELF